MSKIKSWPADCVWPKPLQPGEGMHYVEDLVFGCAVDEEIDDLMDIKEYYDSQVESGRLNEDYSLNEDYDDDDLEDSDEDPEGPWDDEEDPWDHNEDEWTPKLGDEYWLEGRFEQQLWEEDLTDHMNLLKIHDNRLGRTLYDDPAMLIRDTIGYEFVNENLLRQAFTRRAFAEEYGLTGSDGKTECCEELEFLGDAVLNMVVTREILQQFSENDAEHTTAPFRCRYDEGELSKLRAHYTSGEYLSERAAELELGRFILYGSGEVHTDSSLEDMMEALIGAVTIDCNWDQRTIEQLVNTLIYIQLDNPDRFLKQSYYDLFNSWHQKQFGCMPRYEVYRQTGRDYSCTIRFFVPENDRGIHDEQLLTGEGPTRSKARDRAAMHAAGFVRKNGLWIDLRNAGIIPNEENSINQLQELYQKKYLDAPAEYEFEHDSLFDEVWRAVCRCSGIHAVGSGPSKVKAKKSAAYQVLRRLYKSAGIDPEGPAEGPFS